MLKIEHSLHNLMEFGCLEEKFTTGPVYSLTDILEFVEGVRWSIWLKVLKGAYFIVLFSMVIRFMITDTF